MTPLTFDLYLFLKLLVPRSWSYLELFRKLNELDFNSVETLYDSFEWSYSQKNYFDLVTSSDLTLVKVTLNLINWSPDYIQPFHKILYRFD